MFVVLCTASLLGAIFASRYYIRVFSKLHDPSACRAVHQPDARLLPAQLFFFAGGVMAPGRMVRKIFIYQAFTPLIYTLRHHPRRPAAARIGWATRCASVRWPESSCGRRS